MEIEEEPFNTILEIQSFSYNQKNWAVYLLLATHKMIEVVLDEGIR